MRVEYRVTAEDFILLYRKRWRLARELRRLRKNPARDRAERMTVAVLAALAGGSLMVIGSSAFLIAVAGEWAWIIAAFAATAVLGLVAYTLWDAVSAAGARKRFDADPCNADPCVLRVDDTGISFTGPRTATQLDWGGVLGVVTFSKVVGIVGVDELVRPIPMAAFASPATVEELVAVVESRAGAPSVRRG